MADKGRPALSERLLDHLAPHIARLRQFVSADPITNGGDGDPERLAIDASFSPRSTRRSSWSLGNPRSMG
jgi:hypothetical protein